MTLAGQGHNMNPAISLMVSATIAYCDALTAQRMGKVNQQDHAAAPRLLRDALGNALPEAQEKRLRRTLGRKDEVRYRIRSTGLDKANRYLDDLQKFGDWVEPVARPGCATLRPCVVAAKGIRLSSKQGAGGERLKLFAELVGRRYRLGIPENHRLHRGQMRFTP